MHPQDMLKILNESEGNVFNVPANGTEKKVRFRINKVSRRFDRRKFQIRFSAQKCAGNSDGVGGLGEVRTTPIEVLSKRNTKKRRASPDSSPCSTPPRKCSRSAWAKASELDELKAQYGLLFENLRDQLKKQVCICVRACVRACVYLVSKFSRINSSSFVALSLCSKKKSIACGPRYSVAQSQVVTTRSSLVRSALSGHLH